MILLDIICFQETPRIRHDLRGQGCIPDRTRTLYEAAITECHWS